MRKKKKTHFQNEFFKKIHQRKTQHMFYVSVCTLGFHTNSHFQKLSESQTDLKFCTKV